MTPLRRRMLEDMQLRNFASETQRNYIHHIKGLGQFYQTSPEHLDLEDIREYQLHLLNERQHSPQAVNQFVSAAKFFLPGDAGNRLAGEGTAAGSSAS